jgi:hypothetical protein
VRTDHGDHDVGRGDAIRDHPVPVVASEQVAHVQEDVLQP